MIQKVSRWFHTVRHLRPVQVYGRAWFRLSRPSIDLSQTPLLRPISGVWQMPASHKQSLLYPWVFRFLNKERALFNTQDWDDPAVDKLWRYNLHYFDDLNAEKTESRYDWHKALLSRWVVENKPGQGTGWEPYPTSLRIVNWIKWVLNGNGLSEECLHSLAVQARWLSMRLERHLLGNHLFSNAKALIFAGLFFDGPEADKWLDTGLRILEREIPELILPDGGQFELSTMYHALALEDMIDLCNITAAFPQALSESQQLVINGWQDIVVRMRRWLAAMCHEDGEIGLFNDAAIDIAPSAEKLDAYALRLKFPRLSESGEGVVHLDSSGYLRVQCGPVLVLLDVAKVGPDYLPAHGHADTLSFELSLFGQRVLVNTGTSHYGTDEGRLRERGTAAHNTVVVDGQNSSEVWSGFRVARRAYPSLRVIQEQDNRITVEASHDGYMRLPGKNMHIRKWDISSDSMTVQDEISGCFHTAEARFHLHPEIKIEDCQSTEGCVILLLKNGQKVEFAVEGGTLHREDSSWHPRFGEFVPNVCLVASFKSSRLKTLISWRMN